MTLAQQADAATTRDALAAAARLCSDECCVYANTPKTATGDPSMEGCKSADDLR